MAAAAAELEVPLEALQQHATAKLIGRQKAAGHEMRKVGMQLEGLEFEAEALQGRVRVAFDGVQRLRRVEVAGTAGDLRGLARGLLSAMAEAFDRSEEATHGEVWQLYRRNPELLQAPLVQIGAGNTAEDAWANVSRTEESMRLAEDLFRRFDEDGDGYWNLRETSQVQLATEGTEMAEDAFTSLILAAAEDGGRNLSEEELRKGLSKDQVIELYTDAQCQRRLGFLLNIYEDHAKVFQTQEAAAPTAGADTSGAAHGATKGIPSVE